MTPGSPPTKMPSSMSETPDDTHADTATVTPGPLLALQGHMLIEHLVTTSLDDWAETAKGYQTLPTTQLSSGIARCIPGPETPQYSQYESFILTTAESQLDAIIPSVTLAGNVTVPVHETAGVILSRLGATLDCKEGWASILKERLNLVLRGLQNNKTVKFRKLHGDKFAWPDPQDAAWLVVQCIESTSDSLSVVDPADSQPKDSFQDGDVAVENNKTQEFAAHSDGTHSQQPTHQEPLAVAPIHPSVHHGPSPTPQTFVLPCGHATFKYDTQWTGHASTDSRPCFESGEQLLLSDAPTAITNGVSMDDFGRPTDSYWSDLMEAEQDPDRIAGFDTIREPVWQTHRSLAAIQLFGRMFAIPFSTCPVFAGHITNALDVRISAMFESGQVSSEGEMGDMALMWVKEEVAWYVVSQVLEMGGAEQSEVDGAFYLVEDDATNRIECRESLLAAIELYRAEWGMPEPQIVVDGHDSAVDLPGLV